MILYHGTNIDFDNIDISKSTPYKDFGKGFYLTDIRLQAEQMANKKAKLFKGTPIVQEYYFDEKWLKSPNLKVLFNRLLGNGLNLFLKIEVEMSDSNMISI